MHAWLRAPISFVGADPPYASAPVVCTLCSLTDLKPALRTLPAPNAAASTATRPNVRDDGQRPSYRDGMAGFVRVIWVRGEAEYFCARDWTRQIKLMLLGKIDLSRKSVFARASKKRAFGRWLTAGPSYRAVPAQSRALRRTLPTDCGGAAIVRRSPPSRRASRHHRNPIRAVNDGCPLLRAKVGRHSVDLGQRQRSFGAHAMFSRT